MPATGAARQQIPFIQIFALFIRSASILHALYLFIVYARGFFGWKVRHWKLQKILRFAAATLSLTYLSVNLFTSVCRTFDWEGIIITDATVITTIYSAFVPCDGIFVSLFKSNFQARI